MSQYGRASFFKAQSQADEAKELQEEASKGSLIRSVLQTVGSIGAMALMPASASYFTQGLITSLGSALGGAVGTGIAKKRVEGKDNLWFDKERDEVVKGMKASTATGALTSGLGASVMGYMNPAGGPKEFGFFEKQIPKPTITADPGLGLSVKGVPDPKDVGLSVKEGSNVGFSDTTGVVDSTQPEWLQTDAKYDQWVKETYPVTEDPLYKPGMDTQTFPKGTDPKVINDIHSKKHGNLFDARQDRIMNNLITEWNKPFSSELG